VGWGWEGGVKGDKEEADTSRCRRSTSYGVGMGGGVGGAALTDAILCVQLVFVKEGR
jgi:hypothetical protein